MQLRSVIRTSVSHLFLSGFVLLGAPSVALTDMEEDAAAMARPESLEDHEAHSIDPEAREAGSADMVRGESEDPEALEGSVETEEVVEASRPAALEGRSTALEDLGTAKPDGGVEPIDDGRLAGIDEDDLSAEQLLATRRLARAQAKAEAARTRYGDMMRDGYPRGQARERIVERRDASMEALREARRQFDAVMGN